MDQIIYSSYHKQLYTYHNFILQVKSQYLVNYNQERLKKYIYQKLNNLISSVIKIYIFEARHYFCR